MSAHGREPSSTKIELRSARTKILPDRKWSGKLWSRSSPCGSGTITESENYTGPSRGIFMYHMPEKSGKTVMHGLHFEVPLIRLVMPLDSPDGKVLTSSRNASSTLHLQTLLRLI